MPDEKREGQPEAGGISRRQFLLSGSAAVGGAVVFTGCLPAERHFRGQSRVRLAEDTLSAYENWYATTCRQCDAGCGSLVRVVEGRAKKMEGNPDHPVNTGKLCARGQAAVQEQYHPDRIRGPLRRTGDRGTGAYESISWEEALDELVEQLREAEGNGITTLTRPLRGHQARLVGLFTEGVGGQWLSLGAMADLPLRAAVSRLFGQERFPHFDIRNAGYVLSFGANFLGAWISQVNHNRQYGVFRQGEYGHEAFAPRTDRPRGYLVHVEPRFSETASNADEWIVVRPGSEGALALSMAQVIVDEGLGDAQAADLFGDGLEAFAPEQVADRTGVDAERIRALARAFAEARGLAIAGGSAGAHTNGTENLIAALALNVLVGNIGEEGGVILNPEAPVEEIVSSAFISTLDEWADFADAVRGGQVGAVLVHRANPVYELPAPLRMGDALRGAPFIASFSSFMDETTALADLILPSHVQLEDWGDDVPDPAPGYQVWSIQQPIIRPLFDTRSFGDVMLVVASELGGNLADTMPWPTFREMLRETAREVIDLGRGSVANDNFERAWVQLQQQGGWWDADDSPAVEAPQAAEIGSAVQDAVEALEEAEFAGAEEEFPYHLMPFVHNNLAAGQNAHLPWLQALPDPLTSVVWNSWVELNPRMADELGVREGDIVALESPAGRVEVPVYISPAANPEVLGIPVGQGHERFGRWAEDRGVNALSIVDTLRDGESGALAWAATRVRIQPTGRSMALSKFEGTVAAFPVPDHEVAKVTPDA